jgi:phosphonopyruvate decarboxylase
MIKPENLFNYFIKTGIEFFTGVPDSLLKDFNAFVMDNVPEQRHLIAANEGNAIALAAGYHLATGKTPLVYMQNSGIGNAVNPLLSLIDKQVYGIPLILMIGWRGEPGVKDEPQHKKQGAITIEMLEVMGINHCILDINEKNAFHQIDEAINSAQQSNTPFALVIKKGTFEKYQIKSIAQGYFDLFREEAIKVVLDQLDGSEIIVSTTGKTSRELFECRAGKNQPHNSDFLTVGSMGHASQIALGIALNKPDSRVICLDGDGAVLMHLGAIATIGRLAPKNFIHFVINNGAHESVGGQPTGAFNIDLPAIAKACKYTSVFSLSKKEELAKVFNSLSAKDCPALIEVKVKTGSRTDLGRPTITPIDNKINLMKNLQY